MQIRRQQIHLRQQNCATTIDNPENCHNKNDYFLLYSSDESLLDFVTILEKQVLIHGFVFRFMHIIRDI
jgi:hypothetical protein